MDSADYLLAAALPAAVHDPERLSALVRGRRPVEISLAVRLMLSQDPGSVGVAIRLFEALPRYTGIRLAVIQHVRARFRHCLLHHIVWADNGGKYPDTEQVDQRGGETTQVLASAAMSAGSED